MEQDDLYGMGTAQAPLQPSTALDMIVLPSDVLHAGLCHALLTDAEEIMGLVLGRFADKVAYVTHMLVLQRSDKLADRVEISPEQLASAQPKAEELGVSILGWYHSHPKITYLPSHIDLGTQASFQALDERFFGLIFSAFYQDRDRLNRVVATAFQSNAVRDHLTVPVVIERGEAQHGDAGMSPMIQLPRTYYEEERRAYATALEALRGDNSLAATLTAAAHDARYMQTLLGLTATLCAPMLNAAAERRRANERHIARLENELARLEQSQRPHGLPESLL